MCLLKKNYTQSVVKAKTNTHLITRKDITVNYLIGITPPNPLQYVIINKSLLSFAIMLSYKVTLAIPNRTIY